MSLSWPQLANIFQLILFQLTSSTPVPWKWYQQMGLSVFSDSVVPSRSQTQIFLSRDPDTNMVQFLAFQSRPNPSAVWPSNLARCFQPCQFRQTLSSGSAPPVLLATHPLVPTRSLMTSEFCGRAVWTWIFLSPSSPGWQSFLYCVMSQRVSGWGVGSFRNSRALRSTALVPIRQLAGSVNCTLLELVGSQCVRSRSYRNGTCFFQILYSSLSCWLQWSVTGASYIYNQMMKKKQKTSGEIICQFFKLEPQTIYQDYSCSCLSTAIIFFGRLYIGESHFCFNSYMFGVSKRFAIRIDAIKKMEQVKNTITGNYTSSRNEERTFTFGNFVNVGNVFKLMYGLWKGEQIEPRILNEDEQVKGEQEISMDKSQLEISFFNPQQSADNQQTIAEITFPCSVQQYYDYFLKDKSTLYGAQQHYEKKQAQNIEITEWKRNEELGRQVREIRALIKVEKVPMLSRAHLYQIQTLRREETGDLVIEQVTQMSDVPYSSYFTCQETISIRGQDGRCKFKACASVPFNKSSYMKKFIQDRTLKDLKADYELWLHSIQETLENIKNRTSRRQSMSAGGSLNRSIEYEKVQSSTLELSGILDRDFTVSSPTKVSDTSVAKLQRKINVLTGLVLLVLFISIFNLMQLHAMSGNNDPQVLHQQHEH